MKYLILVLFLIATIACKQQGYDLAYATDRDNEMDICITSTTNDEIINLTNSDITEYNFTWSKDGKDIFYTSYEKSGRKVNRINVATKTITTIIHDSTIQSFSDVSKDNTKLIISTNEHHQKSELYLYDLETQLKIRLTNNELYEAGAKFSRDEKTIIASIQTKAGDSINHSGIAEIFEINATDLSTKKLIDLKGFNALPEYAPNGKHIAFHHCASGNCDIRVMNSDGSNIVNLTKGKDDNRWPRWSPDGKWIAFTKTIDKNSDIYFISKDGKVIKPIIATEFRDEIAIFRPK
ncbi:WD40 repeat protein [Flavobacteriaceae bacterium MAR_2010_105]|nr:WD40 repeat protein [Flavobacteriaceae bacterium MAR_2010_105]